MLAQQQQLNLIAHARCFTTLVKINGRRFIAMIDSGAIDNFMTKALVKKEGYFTQKKLDAYNLVIVDENSLFDGNERVDKETKSLSIAI
jgi:predicted aspartyl protease